MAADIISELAWPAVVALALVLFRHQIARALRGIGERAESVKFFSFAIQLAQRMPDEGVETVRFAKVPGDQVTSGEGTLYDYFNAQNPPADYVVVDLGDGGKWLSSRLYLLAVLARRQRGVSRMVFTHHDRYPDVLYGQATVEAVAGALASEDPDLEAALAWALYSAHRLDDGPRVVGPSFDPNSRWAPPEVQVAPHLPTAGPRTYPLGPGGRLTDAPLLLLVDNYLAILRQTPNPLRVGPGATDAEDGDATGAEQAGARDLNEEEASTEEPLLYVEDESEPESAAVATATQDAPGASDCEPPAGWLRTPSGIIEHATWVKPTELALALGEALDISRLCWDGASRAKPGAGAKAGWNALVDQVGRFRELADLRPVAPEDADAP